MTNRKLLVVLLVALVGMSCAHATAPRLEPAASALFAEFETVAHAKVSVLPFDTLSNEKPDSRRFLFGPFGLLFAAFDAIADRTAERVASRTDVILAGFRDFRAPAGLGMVSARTCYVLFTKPDFALADYVGSAARENWEDASVWRWSPELNEYGENDDRASTIIAIEMPPYVLVGNDGDSLFRIARALKTRAGTDLRQLSEWPDVRDRDYWIYRRYRFEGVSDPMAAGIDGVREDAEALVFFVREEGRSSVLRLVAKRDVATAPEALIKDSGLPSLTPIGPRAWETQLPFAESPEAYEAIFIVMGFLGFAIYL